MALVVMLVDVVLPHAGGKRTKDTGPENFVVLPLLAFLGVLGAIAATIVLFVMGDHQPAFNNMVGSDYGALYANLILLTASGLGILLSPQFLKRLQLVHQGEYYALFLFATVGMMLLASATNFVTVFLGIELLSLALYILCAFVARRRASQESGMKYFLLSSFASAFLLYGIALTYGSTNSTSFRGAADAVSLVMKGGNAAPAMLLVAMALMSVGFAFKVSAVPFQAWTPDVYQGAPAPVTAFMSVGTKAAALIAFARVFDVVLLPAHATWMPVIWAIAVLTMVGGNIMAVAQKNVKRMLAYSSVAHAGYLMIGIVVGGVDGIASILFYLFCYAFINVGAFGVVSFLERLDNSGSDASALRGLWHRRPVLAGLLAFFLLSLAGFPPMAGFAGKYYLFYTALVGGHPELLIIGVLASVFGMYYYLRFIATMFMEAPEKEVQPAVAPAATPVRRASGKLSTPSRGGTAVAVKPAAEKEVKVESGVVAEVVDDEPRHNLNWMAWLSLGLSVIGALAMGTVLPFWLVDLARQAAEAMLK
jgi:NADH-quinone oxidoreductase subunit N